MFTRNSQHGSEHASFVTAVRMTWMEAVIMNFGKIDNRQLGIGKSHGKMIALQVLGRAGDQLGAKSHRKPGRFLDLAHTRLNNGKA